MVKHSQNSGIDLDGDGWSQGGQSQTEADAKITFGWK